MSALAEVAAAAADETKKPDAAPAEIDAATLAAASARGWVPKKHFKGDPEKWIDADKFLDRTENELPLVKARNKKLEKQVADMHALLGRVVKSNKEQQDRAVEQAIAKLNEQKREAVKEGDVDKVEAIDKKIDKVKADAKDDEPAPKKKGSDDGLTAEDRAAYSAWLEKNEWFKTDKRLKKFAEGVWAELAESDEDWDDKTLAEQLKIVGKEVRKEFPHKFEKKPKEPSAVEGGTGLLGGSGKKTYADLPPEAKAICDDLIRTKVIKNRDEYLKDYRW